MGCCCFSRSCCCSCLRWICCRSSRYQCFWLLCLSSQSIDQTLLESLYQCIECGKGCHWFSPSGFCRTCSRQTSLSSSDAGVSLNAGSFSPSEQDFENTPPLQKLEKYLKRQVPHYWRTKSHLVGYQDHLPSTKPESTTPEDPQASKADKAAADVQNSLNLPLLSDGKETEEMTLPGLSKNEEMTPSKTANTSLSRTPMERLPTRISLIQTEEAKIKVPQKTPSKYLLEMQQQVYDVVCGDDAIPFVLCRFLSCSIPFKSFAIPTRSKKMRSWFLAGSLVRP